MEQVESSFIAGEYKMVQLWKTVWQFLIKLNTQQPSDPAMPKKNEPMSTAFSIHNSCIGNGSFVVARSLEQPNFPSKENGKTSHSLAI